MLRSFKWFTTKTYPILQLFIGQFTWKSFFLLAGSILFDENIHQSGAQAVFLALMADPKLSCKAANI
jgi:hypothetical protein